MKRILLAAALLMSAVGVGISSPVVQPAPIDRRSAVFIDARTLRINGTDGADTITARVSDDRASFIVDSPRKVSFRLGDFDRIEINAGGGNDFVNIVDASEALETQKKSVKIDGGEGANIVAITLFFCASSASDASTMLTKSLP